MALVAINHRVNSRPLNLHQPEPTAWLAVGTLKRLCLSPSEQSSGLPLAIHALFRRYYGERFISGSPQTLITVICIGFCAGGGSIRLSQTWVPMASISPRAACQRLKACYCAFCPYRTDACKRRRARSACNLAHAEMRRLGMPQWSLAIRSGSSESLRKRRSSKFRLLRSHSSPGQ